MERKNSTINCDQPNRPGIQSLLPRSPLKNPNTLSISHFALKNATHFMYSLLINSEIATPVGHLQNVCFKARHPP